MYRFGHGEKKFATLVEKFGVFFSSPDKKKIYILVKLLNIFDVMLELSVLTTLTTFFENEIR